MMTNHGVALFVGPTGQGKTEVVRVWAKELGEPVTFRYGEYTEAYRG